MRPRWRCSESSRWWGQPPRIGPPQVPPGMYAPTSTTRFDGHSSPERSPSGWRWPPTSSRAGRKRVGPGGPGRLPTQGSHRPVRAHIRAYGSSTDRFAIRKGPRGYSIELRGHAMEPRCVPHVSLDRVCRPTLRFPPQGPPGRVPLLRRYYQSATTSCRPSRRTSLPSLGGTSRCTRSCSLLGGRVRRRGLELVTRWLRPGYCRGDDRISQVPGEPRLSVCTCSVDSGRTACTRPLRCRSVALGIRTAKAPTKGLSKLNSMAFGLAVYASQCRLPRHHARLASGRWSGATGRAFHPQGSNERFQSQLPYISSSFPKLLGAIGSTEVREATSVRPTNGT